MAVPKPIALFAMISSGYLSYHWFKVLTDRDPSVAQPERELAGFGGALESRATKVMDAVQKQRIGIYQQIQKGAVTAPVVARGADLGPIGTRVGVIRELVRRYSGADRKAMKHEGHAAQVGMLKELVGEILSKRCSPPDPKTGKGGWCIDEKNWKKECEALFNFYRANVRYTRDPMFVDTFSAPDRTLKTRAADCDDACVVLGTWFALAGASVRFRVVQTSNEATWSHIYLMVNPNNDGKSWIACDATMPHGFGWEVPGAKESARDGKAHQMVKRVVDFDL